jgi:galactose mutarotase-like enzyme
MSEIDQLGIAEENVLMQAGACSVNLVPAFGGKIASIRVAGNELLQAPLAPMEPRTRTMPFDAGDASGWDECLPSVAACTVDVAGTPAHVPDHGDLWRVAWQADRHSSGAGATFRAKCFSLPLLLERTVSLKATGTQSWDLSLTYKVTNTGDAPVPWSWAAHPLFAVDPGDRIVLPDSIHTLRVEGSGGGRLGKSVNLVKWPIANLAAGGQTDLRVAQPPESEIGDKLFAGPLSAQENWCALERPSVGVRIRFRFDPACTPYLGLWICYGGWPDRPGIKQNCVALEPSTAPVDSLAQTGPWSRTLRPGETYSWPMNVQIEKI